MSHCIPTFLGSVSPVSNGKMIAGRFGTLGKQRLPTDPSGSTYVTFSGVNAISEIRVYSSAGVELAGVESCNVDHLLIWPIYPSGNPNNTVTIRIVHPSYKIKEFNYTASAGVVSLPVQQERDPWYSNP